MIKVGWVRTRWWCGGTSDLSRTGSGTRRARAGPMAISIRRPSIFEPQRLYSPLPAMAQAANALQFSGHLHLRNRLVLSILSGKAVKIDRIRSEDKNPGLRGTHAPHVPPAELTLVSQIMRSACFDCWRGLRMGRLLRYQ